MSHLQYLPGDPRLVDQLVYELKSKGIFDQFRKECIADVDTRPAYQNLRQRVESSVAAFLARQVWCADLNRNQLREKLRKHLLDANYLEQGVERIVDQVVNPKVSSVFIPQVEDVVYNYLGIPRKKSIAVAENSNGKPEDLLPTDLEAVSPGSVKSNNDKNEETEEKMEIDEEKKTEDEVLAIDLPEKEPEGDSRLSGISELTSHDSEGIIDKSNIPMPSEEIRLENIPVPENSPPTVTDKNVDVEKIELPKESEVSTDIYHIPCTENMDIPLPDEIPRVAKDTYFKPLNLNSEEDDSSSDSSLRRNVSPLTPIRNFNNENSCDAQQAFDNDSDSKSDDKKEPNTFRFTIESKSSENSAEEVKEKKEPEALAYQFSNQVNITNYNTPMYDDSSNSNLQIDYESDANSKVVDIKLPEADNSEDSRKDKKDDKRSSSHKSSHRSRDSHRHSSSKDKRSESKHSISSSRDSSRHDRKSSKDDHKSKSNKEKTSDKDKKDSRDSSKQRSSSHKSSSHKDSKHRSSSSSKHSSSSRYDDKKSLNSKDKEKSSSERSKDKSRDSKSSSHRSDKDKDRKKRDDKENKDKKEKKETDDHYSLSGRGNPNRRSTDRDSNDGSSSSKGSHNPSSYKASESKKENKNSSKDHTSNSGGSVSPSDKDVVAKETKRHQNVSQNKKVVRVETHLEAPIAAPPRLPFVPDVTLKKPRFAANLEEAKKMMKMRKFLEDEQKRMNQEAALLLEFQANVRPSLSQVYSSIPGHELEFACGTESSDEQAKIEVEAATPKVEIDTANVMKQDKNEDIRQDEPKDDIAESLIAMHMESVADDTEIVEVESKETDLSIIATLTDDDDEKIEADMSGDGCENESLEEILSDVKSCKDVEIMKGKNELHFFAEHEKYNAELELDKFTRFFKSFTNMAPSKLYLLNCDMYEENLFREVASNFGNYTIVNYHKNGHLKIPDPSKKLIKNVNVTTEISLPTQSLDYDRSLFSPVKSECSFELSSDYDAKLEEMVNKTSRQEIMEIILGGDMESPTKMPRIDYCTESSIDNEISLKRKVTEVEPANNNIVLAPNKIRKLSDSDQISSTTEEIIEMPENKIETTIRSKYFGKAKRVGLPKPKRTSLPNSPSSDKSVENYEQNSPRPHIPNGQVKPRGKLVQRYDTTDLYKPKLHYLSRRNHIS